MDNTNFKVYLNYGFNKLKAKGPKLALLLGLGAGLGAVGYAIKVSMEVEPIVDDHIERITELKENLADCSDANGEEYTSKMYKKDLVKEYLRTAGYFGKLYAPVIALETVAIALPCVGFGVLDKRYGSALALASSTLAEYTGYRERVAEKYGDAVEYEIYHGIKDETVESVDEDGKKKKEKVKSATLTEPGTFTFFLGKDYYEGWDDRMSDEQNLIEMKLRLKSAIQGTNRHVNSKGFVYLDKFVDLLGVKQRDAYRHVAIKYDPAFGDEQFSVNRNVKIRDEHLLKGGEKVLLIEVSGVEVFNIDNWDPIEDFLKLKQNA